MSQHRPWTPEEDKVLLSAKGPTEAYRLMNKQGFMRSRQACRMRREKLLGMRFELTKEQRRKPK